MAMMAAYLYLAPLLPSADQLRSVDYQIPLRVFSRDGRLLGEFGEKRRTPLEYEQFPPALVQAVVAAEDERFFRHGGVDLKGLFRAALELVWYQDIRSGGSTITMQVARNFFLDREQKFIRKFNEIVLAMEIESQLSKEQIMALYLNKIYLGHRSYGAEAAAQVYYGKSLKDLELAQLAMIAGLPKAPSAYNPITNPQRALTRRNWIL
ncbi:MAG: transglycosylase domain-containing protein, partial [Alcanivoracaceae bacterium]|nr:transglycosylase domain-containing protein [Alcanivoracaceae bacterium]